jgi:hypothetical protein
MVAAHEIPVSERMRRWRVALVGFGVVGLAIGGATFLTDVNPTNYPGVALWLAGAIILHDGIAAMAVFAVTVLVRRADRRIPFALLALAQGAAAIVVIVTVLVVPEIVKQSIGSANPSILPLPYPANLLLFIAGVAAATVLAGTTVVVVRYLPGRRSAGPAAGRTR